MPYLKNDRLLGFHLKFLHKEARCRPFSRMTSPKIESLMGNLTFSELWKKVSRTYAQSLERMETNIV